MRLQQRPLRKPMVTFAVNGERDAEFYQLREKRAALGKCGTDKHYLRLPLFALAGARWLRSVGDFVGRTEDPHHISCAVLIRFLNIGGAHHDQQIVAGHRSEKRPPERSVPTAEWVVDVIADDLGYPRFKVVHQPRADEIAVVYPGDVEVGVA